VASDIKSSIVLIQSRLSSSRLPGKALLPIKGYPMVVLAALRAANTGKNVFVVTSNDESDDDLCETLDRYGIPYHRGSLNNVLERFYTFLLGQDDEILVFRLTADNVLPDGKLLDEMEREFILSDVEILNCVPEVSDMPYGVSAELTTAKALKDAYEHATDDIDKEHVTPYIYNHKKSKVFNSRNVRGYNNLRVTVDTFDDYVSVKSLFNDSSDVINESIQSLISNFRNMKFRPYYERPKKPMTLGTVQFGLNYGITNRDGQVSNDEAIDIIRHAATEGVEYIDTAAAYGESEEVIGRALLGGWARRVKVITKLFPFENKSCRDCEEVYWRLAVRNSVLNSCVNLQCSTIDTLMLHRAEQLNNSQIVEELITLKVEGVIENIGVSVQSPRELEATLRNDNVSVIQIPFNILDYRWDNLIESIRVIKKKRSLIIHARSALLQGLLCSNENDKWESVGISNSKEILDWLNKKYKEHFKMSVSDLCICYVNSQDWIDSVVVGVETKQNLFSNLKSVSMPLLCEDALNDIRSTRPRVVETTLDPSTWT
jgi:spore coat polysaccharide biosynthesis protein SpsF (cytidylyltransferase family)/aryl-alcohol dehydrogenase-like predicted oxidoreductase